MIGKRIWSVCGENIFCEGTNSQEILRKIEIAKPVGKAKAGIIM